MTPEESKRILEEYLAQLRGCEPSLHVPEGLEEAIEVAISLTPRDAQDIHIQGVRYFADLRTTPLEKWPSGSNSKFSEILRRYNAGRKGRSTVEDYIMSQARLAPVLPDGWEWEMDPTCVKKYDDATKAWTYEVTLRPKMKTHG